jgi:hypothetical protein
MRGECPFLCLYSTLNLFKDSRKDSIDDISYIFIRKSHYFITKTFQILSSRLVILDLFFLIMQFAIDFD